MTTGKREFWIDEAKHDGLQSVFTKQVEGCIHVIEYSAYEELKKAYDRLLKKWLNEESEEISELRKEIEDAKRGASAEAMLADIANQETREFRAQAEQLAEALDKVRRADPLPDLSSDKYFKAMDYIRILVREALYEYEKFQDKNESK